MEQTLVILKPSAVIRGLMGEVISRFEKKGLIIAGMKMVQLDDKILAEAVVRAMTGATNSRKAEPGTIRGDYSMSGQQNIVHASDSVENAEIELARFFNKSEIFDFKPAMLEYLYAEDEI